MKPIYKNYSVKTSCPDCGGAITTYEPRDSGRELGTYVIDSRHEYEGKAYTRILYILMRCANCGRAGLAKIHDTGQVIDGKLEWFFPNALNHVSLPKGIPEGVIEEFKEAELCASVGAWRAASALFRSCLEKLLKVNGYNKGNLADKINMATGDGIITAARRQKAHDDIRVLGNDVMHDEWREITEEEVELSHHYIHRILEDFYDDRETVESILKLKK